MLLIFQKRVAFWKENNEKVVAKKGLRIISEWECFCGFVEMFQWLIMCATKLVQL